MRFFELLIRRLNNTGGGEDRITVNDLITDYYHEYPDRIKNVKLLQLSKILKDLGYLGVFGLSLSEKTSDDFEDIIILSEIEVK